MACCEATASRLHGPLGIVAAPLHSLPSPSRPSSTPASAALRGAHRRGAIHGCAGSTSIFSSFHYCAVTALRSFGNSNRELLIFPRLDRSLLGQDRLDRSRSVLGQFVIFGGVLLTFTGLVSPDDRWRSRNGARSPSRPHQEETILRRAYRMTSRMIHRVSALLLESLSHCWAEPGEEEGNSRRNVESKRNTRQTWGTSSPSYWPSEPKVGVLAGT